MAHYHQVWNPKPHSVETPLDHWTSIVWKWIKAHTPHLRMIGIALVVVAVAFGIVRGYAHFRESAAMQLLVQSTATDSTPPKSVLETLSQKYPKTATGKYADFLLATQYYQDGNFAESGKLYAGLAERTSVHRLYHLVATEGEGYTQELQGNYAKASEIFQGLAKIKDNPFGDTDLVNAARNEKLAGNTAKAIELLKTSKSPSVATPILALETGLQP